MQDVKLGFDGVSNILNLHPLFVHFPIALILAAIGGYMLGIVLKKELFFIVAKWNLVAGTVSAILAVWTGLAAEEGISHGGNIHAVMEMHEKLGFFIVALSLLLSIWVLATKSNIPSKLKGLFVAGLLILGLAIAQTADLGGRMVFLNGVGVGQKSMLTHELGTVDHEAHEHGSL